MKIFFLAAGQGSRIKGLEKSNKCLIEINNKSLIDYHLDNLEKMKIDNINIITGHNSNNLRKKLLDKKLNFYYNKNYKKMNIASSIHTALINSKDDTLISYTDVIYESKIIKYFEKKKFKRIVIPVLKNWKKIWKQRKVSIYSDAEELVTYKRKIISIGSKFKKSNFTKYQFMGIIFVPKNILPIFSSKFSNNKLFKMDSTTLINYLINEGFEINYKVYDGIWFEFDFLKDVENFQRYYNINKIKNK